MRDIIDTTLNGLIVRVNVLLHETREIRIINDVILNIFINFIFIFWRIEVN